MNIKPQYDEWRFPDGHSVLILAEGRLLNLGCATGHPSFVMTASFTNQVLAQLELHAERREDREAGLMLPKKLDEEVARLHLEKLGVRLTRLTEEQAEYIGVQRGRAVQAGTLSVLTFARVRTSRSEVEAPGTQIGASDSRFALVTSTRWNGLSFAAPASARSPPAPGSGVRFLISIAIFGAVIGVDAQIRSSEQT